MLIFVSMFTLVSCETTYSMQQVVLRLNTAISSLDISSYFNKDGKFNFNEDSIIEKIGANDTVTQQVKILNYSMITFNSFEDMLEGQVIQKEASKGDSTNLYNKLDTFYYALKDQHTVRASIERNNNFNIANTQDYNEYSKWLTRLKTATTASIEANLAIMQTFNNALYNQVNIEHATNSNGITSRTYESRILTAYLIMLKNTSNLFFEKLNTEGLYVYGGDNSSKFESLTDVLNLGELLKSKDVISFNTLSLEKMKTILPNLNHLFNTDNYTMASIEAFDFKNLVENVKRINENYYTANGVTTYLNNSSVVTDKAHYNYIVQEMQNYKNVCEMITNLF